ncbi:hypothetical protein ACFE04_019268 [Oxalis oulophora]
MSQNVKLMPNLDQQSTKLLNLTVLQRIDPFVEEILITAAHVTFYEFNIDLSQWSRKDMEGSLFVVKRNAQPRFQFIVMNRRNTDNLVENLLGDFEFEVQIPYLLYRNANQEVNGIWFYNQRECEEVANLFNRILNAYAKVPQKPKVQSSESEFAELEAVPTMAVMDGPIEPSSSSLTVSNVADVPDDSAFVNFFSVQSAMNIGKTSHPAVTVQHYQTSTAISTPSYPGNVSVSSSTIPTLQIPPPLSSSTPLLSLLDNSESISNNQSKNLVKPSSFFVPPVKMTPPVSLSTPSAPPLNPTSSLQRPYGAPLLQPFPPPTPPPSLTPAPGGPNMNCEAVISRDKVREAVLMLVQDNQFIDMAYNALRSLECFPNSFLAAASRWIGLMMMSHDTVLVSVRLHIVTGLHSELELETSHEYEDEGHHRAY